MTISLYFCFNFLIFNLVNFQVQQLLQELNHSVRYTIQNFKNILRMSDSFNSQILSI